MTIAKKLSRRTFVGTALVGAGVAVGALIRKGPNPGSELKSAGALRKEEFAYDVSEFEKTS